MVLSSKKHQISPRINISSKVSEEDRSRNDILYGAEEDKNVEPETDSVVSRIFKWNWREATSQ